MVASRTDHSENGAACRTDTGRALPLPPPGRFCAGKTPGPTPIGIVHFTPGEQDQNQTWTPVFPSSRPRGNVGALPNDSARNPCGIKHFGEFSLRNTLDRDGLLDVDHDGSGPLGVAPGRYVERGADGPITAQRAHSTAKACRDGEKGRERGICTPNGVSGGLSRLPPDISAITIPGCARHRKEPGKAAGFAGGNRGRDGGLRSWSGRRNPARRRGVRRPGARPPGTARPVPPAVAREVHPPGTPVDPRRRGRGALAGRAALRVRSAERVVNGREQDRDRGCGVVNRGDTWLVREDNGAPGARCRVLQELPAAVARNGGLPWCSRGRTRCCARCSR